MCACNFFYLGGKPRLSKGMRCVIFLLWLSLLVSLILVITGILVLTLWESSDFTRAYNAVVSEFPFKELCSWKGTVNGQPLQVTCEPLEEVQNSNIGGLRKDIPSVRLHAENVPLQNGEAVLMVENVGRIPLKLKQYYKQDVDLICLHKSCPRDVIEAMCTEIGGPLAVVDEEDGDCTTGEKCGECKYVLYAKKLTAVIEKKKYMWRQDRDYHSAYFPFDKEQNVYFEVENAPVALTIFADNDPSIVWQKLKYKKMASQSETQSPSKVAIALIVVFCVWGAISLGLIYLITRRCQTSHEIDGGSTNSCGMPTSSHAPGPADPSAATPANLYDAKFNPAPIAATAMTSITPQAPLAYPAHDKFNPYTHMPTPGAPMMAAGTSYMPPPHSNAGPPMAYNYTYPPAMYQPFPNEYAHAPASSLAPSGASPSGPGTQPPNAPLPTTKNIKDAP